MRLLRNISPFYIFIAGLMLSLAAFGALLIPKAQALGEGERLFMIYDRGIERGIISSKATLRDVLKEANIPLDQNDRVEPGLDEKLATNQYQVNIYRARPVMITDGNVRQLVMSAYQTPKQIAAHAGIELREEDEATVDLNTNFVSDGASLGMTIDRALPIKLTLYGKTETVYTQAETVDELLKEKNITLGTKDDMSLGKTAAIAENMKLNIWRNGKQTVTQEEVIAFNTEQIKDANREPSYKVVNTPGKNGKKTVTYEIVMRDGKEVSRKVIQEVVIEKATKQVETVGAKFNYTGGPLSETQINALGTCESGMTASRNSGNGFYGAFQFMPATWRSVAPAPYNQKMPHQVDLDIQKQAVQNLLSRSSIFTQFPGCAKKMRAQGIL